MYNLGNLYVDEEGYKNIAEAIRYYKMMIDIKEEYIKNENEIMRILDKIGYLLRNDCRKIKSDDNECSSLSDIVCEISDGLDSIDKEFDGFYEHTDGNIWRVIKLYCKLNNKILKGRRYRERIMDVILEEISKRLMINRAQMLALTYKCERIIEIERRNRTKVAIGLLIWSQNSGECVFGIDKNIIQQIANYSDDSQ